MGTLLVKFFQEKAEKLLRVLLVAAMHVAKARQFFDCRIDVFWRKRFAEMFKIIWLESKSQLVDRCSINDFKLAHEQNPETMLAEHDGARSKRQGRLHCINDGGITFELVSGLLGYLIEKIVEWNAKYQDLKDLHT